MGWGYVHFFFSSTTLAGGQACRSKEIERDLETKSKRGHLHLGLTYVTTPSLLALLWPLSGLLTLPRPSAQLSGHHGQRAQWPWSTRPAEEHWPESE